PRQYAGAAGKMLALKRGTIAWVRRAQALGAGEIVLNCMDADGVRDGFDLEQLIAVRAVCNVPLVASGGAGVAEHFVAAFRNAGVDAALAAGALHDGTLAIPALKTALAEAGIPVRPAVPEVA